MEKNAENREYFKDIVGEVHERRVGKGDYGPKELEIYHVGKKDALREVLMLFNQNSRGQTYIQNMWGEYELKNIIEIAIRQVQSKLRQKENILKKMEQQLHEQQSFTTSEDTPE